MISKSLSNGTAELSHSNIGISTIVLKFNFRFMMSNDYFGFSQER